MGSGLALWQVSSDGRNRDFQLLEQLAAGGRYRALFEVIVADAGSYIVHDTLDHGR
jgi:hypothetical protein